MKTAWFGPYLKSWMGVQLELLGLELCYWSWIIRGQKGWPR